MPSPSRHLEWLEPVKAFALLGVLLNHLVEEFGQGPWFTNPSRDWLPLAERLQTFFPSDDSPWIAIPRFLGWLGDATPGVFILASGLGLAWSAWQQPHRAEGWVLDFARRRLGKLYPAYWAAHLVIAALSLLLPVALISLGGPRSLMSLAGIRATDGLFFYINPSWWFFWTILQCYLLFPVLLWLYERVGSAQFLLWTMLITIAARGFGILYIENLYFWMTGMFGLTRLGEFAVGIWAADVLRRRGGQLPPQLSTAAGCLAIGLPIYAVGLGCAVLLVTTVVSNILVTVGLSMIFLSLWHVMRTLGPRTGAHLSWLGGHSYGIYLLHQVPLQWAVQLGVNYGVAVPAALGALAASVPAGVWLEAQASRAYQWLVETERPRGRLELALAITLLVLFAVLEPLLPEGLGRARVCFQVLSIAAFMALCANIATGVGRSVPFKSAWISWWAVMTALGATWVATPGHGDLLVAMTLPIALTIRYGAGQRRFPLVRFIAVFIAVAAALAGMEVSLRQWTPLETNVWGELPALTRHPTRVYGLAPSTVTHLRYNNYDYIVETNSQGLNGPEIAIERPPGTQLRILVLGNAFTMPEGLNWRSAYPALLETRLNECMGPNSVQVINGGITGYSPTEKIAAARELVQQYRPDVVIDQFFLTELDWMSQEPQNRLQEIGLLGNERLRLGRLWGSMQVPLHWRQLRLRLNEVLTGRPSAWRFDKALLRYFSLPPSDAYSSERRSALEAYYRTLAQIAGSAGARLMVLYVPAAVEVQPPATLDYFPWTAALDDAQRYDLDQGWRFLYHSTGAASVNAYSLKSALRSSRERTYFSASWHWSEAGHRTAAKAIADLLIEEGVVRSNCRQGAG